MKKLISLLIIVFFVSTEMLFCQDFDEAVTLYKEGKFDASKSIFEKILTSNPKNYKAKEYLGDIAAQKKQWDTAISIYKELVEKEESNPEYHYKYGGALGLKALSVNKLKALTMLSDIKYHLNRARELDKNHVDVRWALVELYISLPGIVGGSEKKALVYADELMRISKVDGYLAKGYIAEYNDRPEDAEVYYKKAIQVGGSIHTYEKLSGLYENTNSPEKALKNYEHATKKHNRNHLNYQMGKVCAQYNLELDKGLQYLQAYLKNYSSGDGVPKSWAYFRIAQIYRHKKDKANAYNWINKALKAKPDFKDARKEKDLILKM